MLSVRAFYRAPCRAFPFLHLSVRLMLSVSLSALCTYNTICFSHKQKNAHGSRTSLYSPCFPCSSRSSFRCIFRIVYNILVDEKHNEHESTAVRKRPEASISSWYVLSHKKMICSVTTLWLLVTWLLSIQCGVLGMCSTLPAIGKP